MASAQELHLILTTYVGTPVGAEVLPGVWSRRREELVEGVAVVGAAVVGEGVVGGNVGAKVTFGPTSGGLVKIPG
jgi:hypothetical protein